MRRQKVQLKWGQDGNIMLITTIVILVLTIIIATCINISGMQLDLSMLERNTSNTYYLAKSSVEKQVDMINKALDVEMAQIVQKISDCYISELASPHMDTDANKLLAMKGMSTAYTNFYYAHDKLSITSSNLGGSTGLKEKLQKEIHDFVVANYINQPALTYEVQSDHVDTSNYKTTIKVKAEVIKIEDETGTTTTDQTGFKLIATAETKNTVDATVYDSQTVEARVDLYVPDHLPNEIHERYTWAAQVPEILNSALVSFSDVVVTSGGTLDVINGDMQVKGGNGQGSYTFDTNNHIQINASTFSDTTQTGGIIVSNGGRLKVKNGDIACVQNVVATNGWTTSGDYTLNTSISVSNGDIIANTVGIVDDYYEGGKNQSPFNTNKQGTHLGIHVDHNVFVSNDVMISRWVRDSEIDIGGTIFGVNDGSDTNMLHPGTNLYATDTTEFCDPNSSSGVFSQGENTTISAYRILVNGQPYVTLKNNTMPMKLWESVGEPFDGIALWEGYKTGLDTESNKSYLNMDSPFYNLVKRNRVQIGIARSNSSNIKAKCYAPAQISANGITTTASTILNGAEAKKLFIAGLKASDLSAPGAKWMMSQYTNKGDYSGAAYIIQQTVNGAKYYRNTDNNTYDWYNNALMYGKTYTVTPGNMTCNYLGIRSYMTAKRSVFYGTMDEKYIPQLLTFDQVINHLPTAAHKWSYSNPIEVIPSGDQTVDISSFYVDEDGDGAQEVCPSVIINAGSGTLTLKAGSSGEDEFNGVIISKGDVRIEGTLKMNGTLIIGGTKEATNPISRDIRMIGDSESSYSPGLVISSGNHLTITHDANVLLRVQTSDDVLYRQIFDALKLTQYDGNYALNTILGPYKSSHLTYSVGKVFYTTASTLEVQTQNIKAKIKSLKKMR